MIILKNWGNYMSEETKIKKIRKRESYHVFKDLLRMCECMPTYSSILTHVHVLLDSKGAYGSMKNSEFALESIRQLVIDEKADKNRIERFLEFYDKELPPKLKKDLIRWYGTVKI